MPADPGLNIYRIGGGVSDQVIYTGAGRIMAVYLANGASGAQFELNDSTNNGGADVLVVVGTANESQFFDFSEMGGIPFSTGLYLDWTAGTGIKIWFEAA